MDLAPYLEGFRGAVDKTEDGRYQFVGKLERTGPKSIRVYDLPGTTAAFLFSDKKKADQAWKQKHPHTLAINSTDTHVDITFEFEAPVDDQVLAFLTARSVVSVSLANMNLWKLGHSAPHKFDTVRDIAVEHARVRLDTYASRREYEMEQLRAYIARVTDEYRFIQKVIDGPEFLFRRPKEDVVADLDADGFARIDDGFEHLLRMPFSAATAELLAKLARDRAEAEANLAELEGTTVHQMWERELTELEEAYADFLDTRRRRRESPEDGTSTGSIVSRKRPAQAKLKGVSRRPTKRSKPTN